MDEEQMRQIGMSPEEIDFALGRVSEAEAARRRQEEIETLRRQLRDDEEESE